MMMMMMMMMMMKCSRHKLPPWPYYIRGLVVKASTTKAEGPEFESRLRRDLSGSSHE